MIDIAQNITRIIDKIEWLVDQLPYDHAKIEIVMPNKTLTIEKDKSRPIGFKPYTNIK